MHRIPFVLLSLLIAALALAACSGDAPSESDEAASAAFAEQVESAQVGLTVDDADSEAVAKTAPEPGSDIGSDGAGGANNSDEGESRGRTSASAASATTQFVVASARTTVEQSSYRFRWSITLDGVAELPGEVAFRIDRVLVLGFRVTAFRDVKDPGADPHSPPRPPSPQVRGSRPDVDRLDQQHYVGVEYE